MNNGEGHASAVSIFRVILGRTGWVFFINRTKAVNILV